MPLAFLSAREFQKSGRNVKENPPLVIVFVVGSLQLIIAILRFASP
jgi:hypothetical protein